MRITKTSREDGTTLIVEDPQVIDTILIRLQEEYDVDKNSVESHLRGGGTLATVSFIYSDLQG